MSSHQMNIAWARAVMETYQAVNADPNPCDEYDLQDCITDLLHLAYSEGWIKEGNNCELYEAALFNLNCELLEGK